jgi:small subunit ribosomal protein S6
MNYELVYIFSPKLSDEDAEKKAKEITKTIKKEVDKIVVEDFWGKKELAYPIQRFDHGYYVLLQFTASPESIERIDKQLKLLEEMVRFLIVRREKLAAGRDKIRVAEAVEAGGEGKVREKAERVEEASKKEIGKKAKLEKLEKKLDDILEKEIAD